MGSVGIVSWLATLTFPILLLWGFMSGELGPRALLVFVFLGAIALFGLSAVPPNGGYLVIPALAVLDIVLVLRIFKGDVRIT